MKQALHIGMPSVTGYASDEQKEYIKEEMVENGRFDSLSEALNYCIRYTLDNATDFQE